MRRADRAKRAELAELYLRTGKAAVLDMLPAALAADLTLLRAGLIDCRLDLPPATMRRALLEVAGLVNVHLSRETRDALWKRFGAAQCGRAIAAPWLKLHAAIGAEDAKQITAAAQALLQDDLSPELVPYVVAAHMTGLLLSNDAQGALRSFQAHRRRLASGAGPWDPVFRFLIGQTFGG